MHYIMCVLCRDHLDCLAALGLLEKMDKLYERGREGGGVKDIRI